MNEQKELKNTYTY